MKNMKKIILLNAVVLFLLAALLANPALAKSKKEKEEKAKAETEEVTVKQEAAAEAKAKEVKKPVVKAQARPRKAPVKQVVVQAPAEAAPQIEATAPAMDAATLARIEALSQQIALELAKKQNEEALPVEEEEAIDLNGAVEQQPAEAKAQPALQAPVLPQEEAKPAETTVLAQMDEVKTGTPLDLMKAPEAPLAAPAQAAPVEAAKPVQSILESKNDISLPWSRNILLTAGVLALIGAMAMLQAKKRKGGLFKGMSNQQNLKVLQSVSVGPKKHISSIQWQGKTYLLGVTEAGISLLSTSENGNAAQAANQGFDDYLKSESVKSDKSHKPAQHDRSARQDLEVADSVADRIRRKIGAMPVVSEAQIKNNAFKHWPSTNAKARVSQEPLVVNYDSEQGFIKE